MWMRRLAPVLLMTIVFVASACASAITGSRVEAGAEPVGARTVQAVTAAQHSNLAGATA